MINVSLLDAMSQAGWRYEEATHGFTMLSEGGVLWLGYQQAAEMLEAAERGEVVAAESVEPLSRAVAAMLRDVANE